jgi:hypothetical protein
VASRIIALGYNRFARLFELSNCDLAEISPFAGRYAAPNPYLPQPGDFIAIEHMGPVLLSFDQTDWMVLVPGFSRIEL